MTSAGFTIVDSKVEAAFDSYDESVRPKLLALRDLILATAEETDGVGRIEETLKWGQPSYLTPETKSGSTIRLAPTAAKSDFGYGLFFICHTTLVAQYRDLFGAAFNYDGNRALLFSVNVDPPENEVRECVSMALTYHLGRASTSQR